MTNFEKWKDVVLEILRKDDGIMPAIIKGIPVSCDATDCRQCKGSIFYGNDTNCSVAFFEWLCKEYVEPIKLTKRQRAVLDAIDKKFKYMARDFNDDLYVYSVIPEKNNIRRSWDLENEGILVVWQFDYLPDFPFIKWEDKEPYSIEEMLTWEVEDE